MCQLMYPFNAVTLLERCRYSEDAGIRWIGEVVVKVLCLIAFAAYKAVCPLTYHPETLLQRLLEVAADGHHLSDALHARTEFARHAVELAQVPTRNLADHIVQRRLEKRRRSARNGIFQLEQAVAQTEFRSDERKRVAGRF